MKTILEDIVKVFYSDAMVADFGAHFSPSATKPQLVRDALLEHHVPVDILSPEPVTYEDFCLVHADWFVDEIFDLVKANGFGNCSPVVASSLPWTTGALVSAAQAALQDGVAVALCSGFHHAGWSFCGGYCTFNGLMITAAKLLTEQVINSVLILDCDMHYGNGTADILRRLPFPTVRHETFGEKFDEPCHQGEYLLELERVRSELTESPVSLILYQAGADVHVDDPLGGVLDTDGFRERDARVFAMARDLNIPIAWNLAGGYQRNSEGIATPVIELHLITFAECLKVFSSKKE